MQPKTCTLTLPNAEKCCRVSEQCSPCSYGDAVVQSVLFITMLSCTACAVHYGAGGNAVMLYERILFFLILTLVFTCM